LPHPWRLALGCWLTACCLIFLPLLQVPPSRAQAGLVPPVSVSQANRSAASIGGLNALQQQPFYEDLLVTAKAWDDNPITDVLGESPKETILNFYVVMAKVSREQDFLLASASDQSGWFWSQKNRQAIASIDQLWDLAIKALDLSAIPESIQPDMGHEASLKLKQILDYEFNHSQVHLDLPDPRPSKSSTRSASVPMELGPCLILRLSSPTLSRASLRILTIILPQIRFRKSSGSTINWAPR